MEKTSKNANQSLLKQVAPIVGIFSLTILTSAILISSTAKANVTDAVAATLGSSCTLDGVGTDSHTTSLTGGVLTSGIGTTTLTATCNDTEGFSIFAVGYSGDAEGTTDMLSSAGSSYNIATDTPPTPPAQPTDSYWAMKVTPGTGITSKGGFNDYSAIPSSFTKVAEKTSGTQLGTSAVATTTYQIYPTTTQAAGTYTGKVKYTLYHPSTEECPEGYAMEGGVCVAPKYMQTVATWGSTLTTGQSVQAIDQRDNKTYWVTKLADDRIWMTQNLDFDIDSTKTYTSADTDISANWQPSTSTYETGDDTWEETETEPESYDPGELCWNGNLRGDWDGTLDTETVPCTSSNMNYHIGNYYNWTAAVAMNDSSDYVDNETLVSQSICPAGWTLPTSGYNRTGRGSFIDLVTRYGWDEDERAMTGSYQMWDEPLSFVLGGNWVGESSGGVSTFSFYQSSVVAESMNVYNLYLQQDGFVDPQDHPGRLYGFSVRCVAKAPQKTATIAVNDSNYGFVSQDSVTTDQGSAIEVSDNTLMIGSTTITAKAFSGYEFDSWTNNCGDTLSSNCTITANFKEGEVFYMQDVATWGDTELTNEGDTIQVLDSRDNKAYWVTKLADDRIWMTQNLDFDIDSTKTYTSADTDIPANWQPSTSTYTTGTTTWEGSYTEPESYDPGNLCWNGNLNVDEEGTLDTETVPCTSSNMNYHIGNYYNWTAAVAMNDSSEYEDEETLVSQSICPAGWTLPTSGTTRTGSGSFTNLVTQYGWDSEYYMMTGSYQMWDEPLNFVLGGGWDDGGSGAVASLGFYWSSVVGNSESALIMFSFFTGWVFTDTGSDRNVGFSVRCVAKGPQKTATIAVNNSSYGSVSPSTVTTDEGSTISTSDNTVTIGGTTVTATANAGYQFSSWTNSCGSTLSSDCTITANFSATPTYTATISSNNTDYGTVSPSTVTAYQGSSIGTSANVMTIGTHTVTAVAKSGYTFDSWTNNCGSTLTANCTVTANFKTSALYMQNVSTWGSTLTTGQSVQAIDQRDNKSYWVTKLADGNIWMTQNLDFDIDSTKTYTSADTDISANWQPSTSTYTTGTSTWNSSRTAPESYDPGNYYLPNGTSSPVSAASLASDSTDLHYHQGNYYNWAAAVAMNDSSSYTSGGTVVAQSICPAGWTLPLSGNNTGSGSFYYLLDQYGLTSSTTSGSYSIWGAPLSFALGGYWGGSSGYVASGGLYWSSVVVDSNDAYYLIFISDGYVNPQDDANRSSGFSVRCVAVP